MSRKLLFALALSISTVAVAPRAQAHAPVRFNFAALSTSHKVAVASPQLLALLGKGRGNYFLTGFKGNPFNSALSQSTLFSKGSFFGVSHGSIGFKGFILQNRAMATGAFNNGFNSTAIKEALVTNGNLRGSFYTNTGGNNYAVDSTEAPLTYAVGSNNPFNVGGMQTPVGTVPGASALTFSQILGGPAGGASVKLTPSVILNSHASLTSSSELARYNQLKGIGSAGFAQGAKGALALGPVTGGRFAGAFYEPAGGGVYAFYYAKTIYAFGTDPLNQVAIPTITLSNPTSFLTFANGTSKTILSGELFGTFYVPTTGIKVGGLFALGSDVHNLMPGAFTPTSLHSYFFF